MAARVSVPTEGRVPPRIVSSIVYSAVVSDAMALLVAEMVGSTPRLSWANQGAVKLLGYGLEDLRSLTVERLLPSLRGGEVKLLLRRERAATMTLPVRTASGATLESVVVATPSPTGRIWTLRIISRASEVERSLRATADASERRFSTLTSARRSRPCCRSRACGWHTSTTPSAAW